MPFLFIYIGPCIPLHHLKVKKAQHAIQASSQERINCSSVTLQSPSMRARSSCDACNTRKTKCDLAEKKAGNDALTKVSCTFCSSLNLPCRMTNGKKSAPSFSGFKGIKHKKGKRIRELLASAAKESNQDEDNEEDEDEEKEEDEDEDEDEDRNEANHTWQGAKRRHGIVSAISDATLPGSKNRHRDDFAGSTAIRPRLLGIPGLSMSALQCCLDGYFDHLGLWMALSEERDLFMKRYRAFLSLIQGTEPELVDEDEPTIIPMSEMLVLAVASRGAPYTQYKNLETALLDRTYFLATNADTKVLEELDGIEAVNTLAERNTRPLHLISPGGNRPNFLVLDPFGKGFSAELCLFTKLNEESPPFTSDYHRRHHLFWVIFCHDAIRSASACRMYRLHDEDVGWPLRINFHRQPMVALAFIARKICRIMLSSRARCLGIDASDIMSLLDDLADWPKTVNMSVEILDEIPLQSSFVPSHGTTPTNCTTPKSWQQTDSADSPQALEHQARVKQCIVLGLWLRLTLSIWTALHEIGYLASSEVMIRAEEETARAAKRMMKLAERCITYGIVDYGPNALLTTSAAWILYCARKLSDIRADSNYSSEASSSHEIGRLLELANVLLQAVRSAKTRPEAEALAKRLEGMLQRASPVPIVDISRLAESSTAHIQAFDNDGGLQPDGDMDYSRNKVRHHSGVKHKAKDGNFFLSDTDLQHASISGMENVFNNGAGYVHRQETVPQIVNTTGSWPTPETPHSLGNTLWNVQIAAPFGEGRSLEQANKRLAPNYPTGFGVAGDEDFLTFMAICGFDDTPRFVRNSSVFDVFR